MRFILGSTLLLLPLMPGCIAAAAGATTALVLGSTTMQNKYVAHVPERSSIVWPSVKMTLSRMSLVPIETDGDFRTALAHIDNHKVRVSVETYDVDQSRILVEALQYGFHDPKMAEIVTNRIVNDLTNP
jgi:hypothetical protein